MDMINGYLLTISIESIKILYKASFLLTFFQFKYKNLIVKGNQDEKS